MSEPNKDFFNTVYSVLVEKAGAIEANRPDFIARHVDTVSPCDEWRFQGELGFGGKYWRRDNKVTCYSEDANSEIGALIAETNVVLSSLNTQIQPRHDFMISTCRVVWGWLRCLPPIVWKWCVCRWLHDKHRCFPEVWGRGLDGPWHCCKCHPCSEDLEEFLKLNAEPSHTPTD